MSSDLLLSWLNKDVGLSSPVTNFEKDFSNGYLFGEILSKFNHQPNFPLFSSKDAFRDRVGNFGLLGPSMKTLNIEFNAKIVDSIMKQEKGAAMKILYQLKMELEKIPAPVEAHPLKRSGTRLTTTTSLVKIRPGREGYVNMQSLLVNRSTNKLKMTQKQIDLENRIAKYVRVQAVSLEKALAREEKERERQSRSRDERRNMMLEKMKRQMSLKQELKEQGWSNWEKNLQAKRDKEQQEREFQVKVMMKARLAEMDERKHERKEMLRSIDDFEDNVRRFRDVVETGMDS